MKNKKLYFSTYLIGTCRKCLLYLIALFSLCIFVSSTEATIENTPCLLEPTDMIITYGTLINCSIDISGDSDTFRFSGTDGERIVIQGSWQSGALRPCVTLVSPDTSQLSMCNNAFTNRIDTTLSLTGTYSIIIHDWFGTSTGTYGLALERVFPPSAGTLPIQYGETMNEEINLGGDIDLFSFEGTENDSIIITASWIAGSLRPCIELFPPEGDVIKTCNNAFTNSINTKLNTTGTYSVLIYDWFGTSIGEYSLNIQCLSGPCTPLPTHNLSVSKIGTGTGQVTSQPVGINCGDDCSDIYNHGTGVTLTAISDPGSTFSGWSGDGCSGTEQCVINMNNDKSITATFTLSPPSPDLTGQWTSLEQTCKNTKKGIKCKIKGKVNIQNIGQVNAKTSFVRFYLSDDEYYDNGDSYLKQVATGTVKTGKSKNKSLSYSLSTGINASGKYVLAVIDAYDIIPESDETNNVVSFFIPY
jgi:hypothetical protein